jgi:hypothetical protein
MPKLNLSQAEQLFDYRVALALDLAPCLRHNCFKSRALECGRLHDDDGQETPYRKHSVVLGLLVASDQSTTSPTTCADPQRHAPVSACMAGMLQYVSLLDSAQTSWLRATATLMLFLYAGGSSMYS